MNKNRLCFLITKGLNKQDVEKVDKKLRELVNTEDINFRTSYLNINTQHIYRATFLHDVEDTDIKRVLRDKLKAELEQWKRKDIYVVPVFNAMQTELLNKFGYQISLDSSKLYDYRVFNTNEYSGSGELRFTENIKASFISFVNKSYSNLRVAELTNEDKKLLDAMNIHIAKPEIAESIYDWMNDE